jgi:hypothetical protein
MEDVGTCYDHVVYLTAIRYILWSFGIFFPFWYDVFSKKNLATLLVSKYMPTYIHTYVEISCRRNAYVWSSD